MCQATGARRIGKRACRNGGFTLLELMITGTVLAIAACGMAAVMVNSMVLTSVNKETAMAREAARQVLEQIEDIPAHEVYSTFGGGEPIPVEGETATATAEPIVTPPLLIEGGNLTAEIIFPDAGIRGVLREDIKDPTLGMPRDLNGDGVIDSENHALDYRLLPLKIEVTWEGVNGPCKYQMCTVLLNH